MNRTSTSRIPLAMLTAAIAFTGACSTSDATGPVDGGDDVPPPPPPTPQVSVTAAINQVRAIHDCDTAADNPGDFHAWVEIWQDTNPSRTVAEYVQVGKSAEHTVTLDSESTTSYVSIASGSARLTRRLDKDRNRPIQVRAYMQERDPGVDATAQSLAVYSFSTSLDCWLANTRCLGPGGDPRYTDALSGSAYPREDVFDIFNLSDDEGCRFDFRGEVVLVDA